MSDMRKQLIAFFSGLMKGGLMVANRDRRKHADAILALPTSTMLSRVCPECGGSKVDNDVHCGKYPVICNYQQGHSGRYCGSPDGCEDQWFTDCPSCTDGKQSRAMNLAEVVEHHADLMADETIHHQVRGVDVIDKDGAEWNVEANSEQ